MQSYHCIIVDDELLARELLEAYIQRVPFLKLLGVYASAIEASQALQAQRVDIMFLDIQMPHLSGLDFLKTLQHKPVTILTTAYTEYAIEAFSLEVLDYLLKPIEFDRFFQAINKALKALSPLPQTETKIQQEVASVEQEVADDYFFVKTDQKIVKVNFSEVLFIEGLQKYVKIYTSGNEVLISLLSLSRLLEELPCPPFVRIHRSYIINIHHIHSIQGNVVSIHQHHLPISKGQRDVFFQLIDDKRIS